MLNIKNKSKITILTLMACLLIILFILTGCEIYKLDRQVDELCNKDGGLTIYESVELPSEMFDKKGRPFPGIREKKSEDITQEGYRVIHDLNSDYESIHEVEYIKRGNSNQLFSEGELLRSVVKIIRLSDKKILAMYVTYGRIGGEFILIGHPSSYRCPQDSKAEPFFEKKIFIKQGE